MNRAKNALIVLTVLLAAAGAALLIVGATHTRPEVLTYGTLTGRSVPDPLYGLVWSGVGLLGWSLLTLIVTLAAAMVCWEVRELRPRPVEIEAPQRKSAPRAPLKRGTLTWSD